MTEPVRVRALSSFLGLPVSGQADFFAELEVEMREVHRDHGQAGEFTGAGLFSSRPAIYKAVVSLLGAGMSAREVADQLGVSKNTVTAVRHRERPSVGTALEETAANLAAFAQLGSKRMLEGVEDMPVGQLAVPVSIAIERVRDLGGGGAREVVIEEAGELEEFRAFIAALPTGLGAGARGEKEGAVAVDGECKSLGLSLSSRDGVTAVGTASEGRRGSQNATPPALLPIQPPGSEPGAKAP